MHNHTTLQPKTPNYTYKNQTPDYYHLLPFEVNFKGHSGTIEALNYHYTL
jgi:hypothetical protein